MNKTNIQNHKGFTLIELLLVISIIALLSSIVLTSVQEARDKARLQAALSQMIEYQKEAELYYLSNSTYINEDDFDAVGDTDDDTGCSTRGDYYFLDIGSGATAKINNLMNNHAGSDFDVQVRCGGGNNGDNYVLAIDAPVKTIEHVFYDPYTGLNFPGTINTICIDSTGFAGYLNRKINELDMDSRSFLCDRSKP